MRAALPWLPVALALALAAEKAQAQEQLHLGHVATGVASVRLDLGSDAVDLGYGEFRTLDLAGGARTVRAIALPAGAVLAELDIELRPDYGLTPVLYLAGDGERQPYRLTLDQLARPEGTPPVATGRRSFVVHHEATAGTQDGDLRVRFEAQCDRQPSPLPVGVFESIEIPYGGQWREPEPLTDLDGLACEIALAAPDLGGFRTLLAQSAEVATRRAFLIGDGASRPVQLLLLDGAQRVAMLDLPLPQPRPLAGSRDHWFDRVRPDQGLSLFEVGGTGIVFGTWFTVAADGNPTWFYFEGARVQGIGRRDIAIYRGSRAAGAQALTAVGSGRLQYVDCNELELRVLFADGEFRSMRARRSQSVSFCPVFD
jgi:hypothetical protein